MGKYVHSKFNWLAALRANHLFLYSGYDWKVITYLLDLSFHKHLRIEIEKTGEALNDQGKILQVNGSIKANGVSMQLAVSVEVRQACISIVHKSNNNQSSKTRAFCNP